MKHSIWVLAGLALAQPAFAADIRADKSAGSHLDLYYSNLKLKASYQGDSESIDGDGGGLGLWMGNGPGLFTAEFQRNKLDGNVLGTDVNAHARQWRAGMGWRFLDQPDAGLWLRAEYVNFKGDITVQDLGSASDSQTGYGIHAGGLMGRGPFQGYGEVGRIELDDLDGFEFKVGANYQPGLVGGFIEYRYTDLETDQLHIKEKYGDFRVGVRVGFQ